MRDRIDEYMRELLAYPDRHVGGPGNQAATAMVAETIRGFGFVVRRTPFDCIEWEHGEALLEAGGEPFDVHVGPYSPAVAVEARLVSAVSVEELETVDLTGAVVLIHGPLASSQLMPKNFTWYNPESHKRVIRALEERGAAAVVAATGRDPGMVGSQYPFPLIEDGDFDVPHAYMRDIDGERLLAHAGETVRLRLDSRRIPTTAEHVVATLPGSRPGRIVITAHIDSRKGSPGAMDNASGVATVLAAAELLAGRSDGPTLEFVPFNGEDDYANPGEMLWIAENEGRFGDILLGINVDDMGMHGTADHVSFYGCPPAVEAVVRETMAEYERVEEGPAWPQGDHSILGMYGRPAIALASSRMHEFMAEYAHTERDTLDLVDASLIEEGARFIGEVVTRLGREG